MRRRLASARYREDDQEARLEQLESQQKQQAPPAAPSSAPAAGGTDVVNRLKELSELQASGALTQEEFDAGKAKLLAS